MTSSDDSITNKPSVAPKQTGTFPVNQVAHSSGFLPNGFEVPSVTWNDMYRIRPLQVEDADIDYDCYMSCVDYLRDGGFIQPPGAPYLDWPRLDQPRRWSTVLLGHAEYQLAAGEAIEYGIFNLDNTEEYGCLYVRRSGNLDYSCAVTFWIRESHQSLLDAELHTFAQEWIASAFPFSGPVGFPGRSISWSDWQQLRSR